MSRILVVDDEKSMREFLDIALSQEGYQIITAENGYKAIDILQDQPPDLVITDMKMSGKTGMDVLAEAKEVSSFLPVVMITAYSSTNDAVETMKLGAVDYIIKPFNLEELKLIAKNALEKGTLKQENVYL